MVTNVFLPSLDDVTAENAGPLVARDAPSAQAAIHQGNDFDESNYTSVAVLLLETKDRKLGEQDHQYYNEVVRRLLDDTKHVASVQDLWGKPVTMSGSQSADAEATTLTIRPTGDLGSSEANESIAAIRDIVAKVPKPDGLSAYITGTCTTGGRYPARHGFEPGQADDRDGHPDRHLAAHCLSVDHDRADPAVRGAHHAGGGPRHHLVPRGAGSHRDLLVRVQLAGVPGLGCLDGLCDFLPRSIPGSPSKWRRQGIVLLRVRRQRAARHLGVGYCDLGRHAVPEPDASGLLPHPRSAVCGVDGRRRPLGADPGPGAAHDGEQDRLDPAAEEAGQPGVAQGRHYDRPVAGADDCACRAHHSVVHAGSGRPTR